MHRPRSTWFVAIGSALAVVLIISGAAFALGGPAPSGDRQLTPANAELEGDAAEDRGPVDPAADGRGACVSAVAESDAVGGKNENHGGAVSEAARYTCRGLEPGDSPGRGKGPPPWAGGEGGPPWAGNDDKPGNGPPPWAGEGRPPWAGEGRPPWAGEGRPPWTGDGPPPWANDRAGRDADE